MTRGFALMLGLVSALFATPSRATPDTGEVNLTATSANVKEPGSPVKIHVIRWSTDEERTPVVTALNPAAAGPAIAGAVPSAAAGAGQTAPAARGRAGRGGRGGARGGRGTAPPNPFAILTTAIGRGPTLGYIWTTDVTGYSIKYAYHASLPDGSERIILATDRRLGAYIPAWRPVGTAALTDYEFTLVEIRLDSKGVGEGKTSLTTKVVGDDEAKTVALDDYAGTPVILQKVEKSKVQREK
jgi:hypothetical protein